MSKKSSILKNKTALKYLLSFTIAIAIVFSLQSCDKKKQVQSKKPDNTAEIKRLTIIADKQYENNEFETAFVNYNKIVSLSDPKINRIDYVDALISIGYIQLNHGNYAESEATTVKILPHLKYMKKPRFAWETYNILGLNYFRTYDFDNALIYFKKALNLNTTEWRKINAESNIGLVYMGQQKYKEAISLYTKITTKGYLADKKKTNTLTKYNYLDYAIMRNNLGVCYFELKNTKAILCHKEVLKIRLKINDRAGILDSYFNLSEYYLKTNPKLAKKYAEIGYKKSFEFKSHIAKFDFLSLLIQTSKGKELKKYSLIYSKLIHSSELASKKTKNQFSNIKYNSKKDKTENLELKKQKAENELQLERQKNRNFISYIIIIVAASIVLFLYFHLSLKGKKQKKEAIYNSEMRISKKLHDELANDVFTTMAFIENKNISLEENKEHLLKNLDTIYSRTRDISKENSTIITDKNYPISLKEMISGFKTSNINLLLNGFETISWDELDKNKKITIYRVLQELLVNMKKHSEASLVGINFKSLDKNVFINYTDNGKGVNINNIILKNGLHNVENRIISIGGTIDIDSDLDKGFKVYVKFPT